MGGDFIKSIESGPRVLDVLGHTGTELGVCLFGTIGCNGTCPLDPERPFASRGRRKGEIECFDVECEICYSEFCTGGKLCNERCIGRDEDCDDDE